MRFIELEFSDLEEVDVDKLNQMGSNEDFIYLNLMKLYHTNGRQAGDKPGRSSRIPRRTPKIFCGIEGVPAYDMGQHRNVYFPTPFGLGCSPVVVASLETKNRARTMITIKGRGSSKYAYSRAPDRFGFSYILRYQLGLTSAQKEPFKRQRVHWMAVGYV